MKDENKSSLFVHILIVMIVAGIFIVLSCINLAQASAPVERPVEPLVPQGEFLPHIPDRELTMPQLIRVVAKEHGLSSWEGDRMVSIAWCESRFVESVVNQYGYSGLFQIGKREWLTYGNGGNPLVAEDNIRAAIRLYEKRGFQPWICNNLI